MTGWFIILPLLFVSLVLLASAAWRWCAIDDIKAMWRFWTVRLQAISAVISGGLFFDPQAMLYAMNLLPGHVRAILPPSVSQAISVVGAVIFFLNLLTIISHGVAQPKARR